MTLERLAEAPIAHDPATSDFLSEVLAGLSLARKSLPSRFFYDDRGSELFEQITELPEYYPTRTEIQLLTQCAAEIADALPSGAAVVEFGSGSSRKTELLLSALRDPAAYIPVEISRAALYPAAARIAKLFPKLAVYPILGGFHVLDGLKLPGKRLTLIGFFPGSTIGNMDAAEAMSFLGAARRLLGPDAFFLIGADLIKPLDILLPAYNDARGVTAAFNLNMLARINRELDGTFDLDAFEHEAVFNSEESRIEMYLRSKSTQTVQVFGHLFSFRAGETIHTENSYKYELTGFKALAAQSGWRSIKIWVDSNRLFSLHLLG
jgi:dimethylhistidine N-methyltransferase